MIKYATKRLKFKHTPTDSRIKTVNIDPQSAHGVAISIGAKLGYWKGTTNFAIIKMDIFDMILGRSSPHNVIPWLTPIAIVNGSWDENELVWCQLLLYHKQNQAQL